MRLPPTDTNSGRVSTEDQQDPESSRAWQLSRSLALIEPHGGQVTSEFFDIGAVVYFLRKVVWMVPGFTVEAYRAALADRVVPSPSLIDGSG